VQRVHYDPCKFIEDHQEAIHSILYKFMDENFYMHLPEKGIFHASITLTSGLQLVKEITNHLSYKDMKTIKV
jgi:hypothetical protein